LFVYRWERLTQNHEKTRNHIPLKRLFVDWEDINRELSQIKWNRIEDPNRRTVQYYNSYQPDWLVNQLQCDWHSMGLLYAVGPQSYLEPHVDYKRTCAILIPCTSSYESVPLDFWDIPTWGGELEDNIYFNRFMGSKTETIYFNEPILFRNIPHGVDNTGSLAPRINLSVCFLAPNSFDDLAEEYENGRLLSHQSSLINDRSQ
jgi:hypothetical protein